MSGKRLIFVLFFLLLLTVPGLAQSDVAEAGRAVTREDWLARIPVVLGAIALVLVVDAFFILPIFRSGESKEKVSS